MRGEAPTLAGRLLARAEPGAVLIDGATRRLIGDFFTYRDLGSGANAAVAATVHAWQVLSANAIDDRFEALRGRTTTRRLVGREEELRSLLNRRWAQARSGEGCVVLIAGEPGIGKSRLTQCLQQVLQGEPHAIWRFFCSPHGVAGRSSSSGTSDECAVQTMAGLFSEARQTLDAGIQAAEQTEERWANAELWRLRGASALAARGAAGVGEAAEYFRRAIDVVGQQESRLRGLRVATNLARLLADEGRIEAAREMLINALGPICGGADTPDPKEAHDLLRKGTSDLVRAP